MMKPRQRGYRRPDRHAIYKAQGRASTYIHGIDEIKPGTRVWLWCRVSSDPQNAKGNNDNQEADLRAAVEAVGGNVAGVTPYVGVAYGDKYERELYKAATCAARAGAVLLAESTSRFVRHPDYNPKAPRPRMPGADDLRNLRLVCGDVVLVTMHDPDATNEEERGHQTKRGQGQKGSKGGRPPKAKPVKYKPNYRDTHAINKLTWMLRLGIVSKKKIARELGRSRTTIQSWIKQWEERWERPWPGDK